MWCATLSSRSWHRCRRNGVNPATKSAPLQVKGPDVDRFHLSNAEFYDAVRACVPPIVPYLIGSRTILITSDPHGTLLSVDGDPQPYRPHWPPIISFPARPGMRTPAAPMR